jgi:hypothetical protein
MLIEAVVRDEPELGLNAMEHPVEHHLLPCRGVLLREKDKGKLNHRTPPHVTGPSAKPEKRGVGPAGSGWLVARVPVAWSTITSGPQSDTPHSRPASRSQSVVASLK